MARLRDRSARLRPLVTLIGALAGLAAWLFWDVFYDGFSDLRLYMLLASFIFGTFFMLLALVGPARFWPSLGCATGVSAVIAALLYWASFRYDAVESYLAAGYPLAAFWLFLIIATPFAAARLRGTGGWHSYPDLFDTSWRIFVRYLAALLFTALFWALLGLSDALLKLVGLRLMSWIQGAEPLDWVLTGTVFGLALGVVHDLRDYLSPYLVLQLLRLLLPVVLVVVLVFLLALPFQGLSDLIGTLSAAGTLMSAAIAAIILITVAVDRDAEDEVRWPWMRPMVQVLALLVPLLGALAVYALWLRVEQYGWTPERLVAATVAGMVLLYGIAYGGAVVLRRDWAERIRRANIALALVALAVIALWLSPLLVPERIAARDQLARFEAGRLSDDRLPLRELARDWGRPGQAVLEEIDRGGALSERIAALRAEATAEAPQDLRARLAAQMPVIGGDALKASDLSQLDDLVLMQWRSACERPVAEGPGCALVLGEFQARAEAQLGILLLTNEIGGVTARAVRRDRGEVQMSGYVLDLMDGASYELPVSVLAAVHDGTARIAAPDIRALIVGEHALFPHN